MYLHVDSIAHQSILGVTVMPEKIAANLDLIVPLKEGLVARRQTNSNPITVVTALGRWLVVYENQVADLTVAKMHFIDSRVNVHAIAFNKFSDLTARNILHTQAKYGQMYLPKHNTVELTFAEAYEVTISPNLFACNKDEQVLAKAKKLGVLPMIDTLKEGDTTKVCFADEIIAIDGESCKNIYALFHFGGHSQKNAEENGFVYLKLWDIQSNPETIELLLDKVRDTGCTFDRVAFLDRFMPIKYN